MKQKALTAITALMLAFSAVSCGNDDEKNQVRVAYGESTRTTAEAEMEEETTAPAETEEENEEIIEMPDVTGMKAELAEDILRMLGLESETEDLPDADIEQGCVIKSEPVADTEVKTGEKVKLYISTGANAD